MISVARTMHDIEITAENLQEEKYRLEAQRQALERELAAVVAHLGSVRTVLGVLRDLIQVAPATATAQGTRGVAGMPRPETPRAPAASARPQRGRTSATTSRPGVGDDAGQGRYGRLTEQILEYVAAAGTGVRARDVAAALGRDTDSGSINAVRSTLDRLVATSRVQRAGRGLYLAEPS
ncbi:hypothetical protein ACFW5X_35360 [Streptomyces albogriseolus]|uniref:hypothetical protein n=1 Tax=Streptomyces albogriseolus TaxID=1887 RepID=UPI0036819092